jgi:hypothetical protein
MKREDFSILTREEFPRSPVDPVRFISDTDQLFLHSGSGSYPKFRPRRTNFTCTVLSMTAAQLFKHFKAFLRK